jgi:hypothetical protein
MNLDGVKAEDLQDWKDDDTTGAYGRALRADHQRLLQDLEIAAATGREASFVYALGGKCAQLRSLIQDITNARGKESE